MSLLHHLPGQFKTVFMGGEGTSTGQCLEPILTCEIHGEPGADVLNLQVQQAVDVLGFGGRPGVAGMVVQHLNEISSLARFEDQVLLVGVGVHPAGRGTR